MWQGGGVGGGGMDGRGEHAWWGMFGEASVFGGASVLGGGDMCGRGPAWWGMGGMAGGCVARECTCRRDDH